MNVTAPLTQTLLPCSGASVPCTRMLTGVTTPAKLRSMRRYAYLGCAVLAALLPGVDPLTMLIEMVPLIVLYEASIVLAAISARFRRLWWRLYRK